MSSVTRSFIKKIVVLLIFLIVLDYAAGGVLKFFFLKHEPLFSSSTRYVLNSSNEKMVIFGSSHAFCHYIPSRIADSTKMTCLNAGLTGHYILYSYALLKAVLHRYTPGVVILDIRGDDFEVNAANYERLSILAPYYQDHPEIRNIIEQQSRFENIKLLSRTYQFNSQLLSIISRNIRRNPDEFKSPDLYRTAYQTDSVTVAPNGDYYRDKPLDENLVNTYRSFIKDCLAHHIKLYIFISPILPHLKHETKTASLASKIAAEYQVPFFNYLDNDRFKRSALFSDFEHLNLTGAKLYTDSVIRDIRDTHH